MATLKSIHGKKAIIYIKPQSAPVGDTIVSTTQDFSIDFSSQFEQAATVMTGDLVLDTQTQAYMARLSVSTYLSEPEVFALLSTNYDTQDGATDVLDPSNTSVADYASAISSFLSNDNNIYTNYKFDVVVYKVAKGSAGSVDNVVEGFVTELRNLALTRFEITGTKGDYLIVRFEGITGEVKFTKKGV